MARLRQVTIFVILQDNSLWGGSIFEKRWNCVLKTPTTYWPMVIDSCQCFHRSVYCWGCHRQLYQQSQATSWYIKGVTSLFLYALGRLIVFSTIYRFAIGTCISQSATGTCMIHFFGQIVFSAVYNLALGIFWFKQGLTGFTPRLYSYYYRSGEGSSFYHKWSLPSYLHVVGSLSFGLCTRYTYDSWLRSGLSY